MDFEKVQLDNGCLERDVYVEHPKPLDVLLFETALLVYWYSP